MPPLLALLAALPAAASVDWQAVAARAAADAEAQAALGPRPAGSPAEARLAAWVAAALADAGWATTAAPGCPDCVLACRGAPRRLLLAHLDSVPDSPGAVDNLAGVTALVHLARHTTARDLCLGFPSAEEAGLVGARQLAAAWPAPLPELVVALDLTGHGRLSVTGLGPAWGGARLAWLAAQADVDSPYAYRAVSRALPQLERSDHLPFAWRGVPSLHLLGRGPHGVFERYHQPADTAVDPEAMRDLLVALDALAVAPPLPSGRPDAAALVGRRVVPAWLVWLLIAAGLAQAARDVVRPCEGRPVLGALSGLWSSAWRATLAAAAAAAGMAAPTLLGLLPTRTGEATAAAVMGVPATGWWAGATPGLLLGLAAWLGARRLLGQRGSPALAAGVLTLLALAVDPLLALPYAVGALLAPLHPLLGALPALYLLSPDKLRELAFHGLLPPVAWGLLWLQAWPGLGARRRRAAAARAAPGHTPRPDPAEAR